MSFIGVMQIRIRNNLLIYIYFQTLLENGETYIEGKDRNGQTVTFMYFVAYLHPTYINFPVTCWTVFIDSTGENLVTNFLIVGRKPFPATHKYNLADISDGLRGDRIKTNLANPPKSKIFGEAEVSGGEDSLKYLGIWTWLHKHILDTSFQRKT